VYVLFHFQEEVLLEPNYEVPESDVTQVTVTKDSVMGTSPVSYTRQPPQEHFDEPVAI